MAGVSVIGLVNLWDLEINRTVAMTLQNVLSCCIKLVDRLKKSGAIKQQG